jgi:hypothetical protein
MIIVEDWAVYRIFIFGRCALDIQGLLHPKKFTVITTGPGDPGRIGSNLRVVGIIIWGSLNNWQYPLGFIK